MGGRVRGRAGLPRAPCVSDAPTQNTIVLPSVSGNVVIETTGGSDAVRGRRASVGGKSVEMVVTDTKSGRRASVKVSAGAHGSILQELRVDAPPGEPKSKDRPRRHSHSTAADAPPPRPGHLAAAAVMSLQKGAPVARSREAPPRDATRAAEPTTPPSAVSTRMAPVYRGGPVVSLGAGSSDRLDAIRLDYASFEAPEIVAARQIAPPERRAGHPPAPAPVPTHAHGAKSRARRKSVS